MTTEVEDVQLEFVALPNVWEDLFAVVRAGDDRFIVVYESSENSRLIWISFR